MKNSTKRFYLSMVMGGLVGGALSSVHIEMIKKPGLFFLIVIPVLILSSILLNLAFPDTKKRIITVEDRINGKDL